MKELLIQLTNFASQKQWIQHQINQENGFH